MSAMVALDDWVLSDSERGPLCRTTDEADIENCLDRLSELTNHPSSIVDIQSPDGQLLSVGISRVTHDYRVLPEPLAWVHHACGEDEDPIFRMPDTDIGTDSEDILVFHWNGETSEASRRELVPVPQMREIVRYFMRTMTLPDWIEWKRI